MSSSLATWLPAAIAPATGALPTSTGPRHLAPGLGDDVGHTAFMAFGEVSTGRHAEAEWSRELFDPRRDGDPFAWLGFSGDGA
jgi:hypothetical protein